MAGINASSLRFISKLRDMPATCRVRIQGRWRNDVTPADHFDVPEHIQLSKATEELIGREKRSDADPGFHWEVMKVTQKEESRFQRAGCTFNPTRSDLTRIETFV